MARVVMVILTLAVTIYALVDCVQTPDERIRNLPKLGWVGLIVIVTWAGPIAWFIAGRPQTSPPWGPMGRGKPPGKPGPRGPEDDPDFLRGL